MKLARNILLGVAGLVLTGLVYIYVEFVVTRGGTPAIPGDHSVAVLETIELGGVPQWVLIRGHDARKPVLLFLHGGPGMPAMFLAHDFQREMEQDFVMVHWDRRGAGKSFAAAAAGELSVSQTLADTLELTRILKRRFDQERIFLVGHSWGSYLGLLAAREQPSDFHAFIGTGQLAGSQDEVRTSRQAFAIRKEGTAGESDLTEDDLFRLGGELYGETSFWPIIGTGIFAPEYTFSDALNIGPGASSVGQRMQYDLSPRPHEGEVASLEIPVFFLLGRHDFNTPSELAAAYLKRIDSPMKAVLWFEHSAHFPFWEEPVRFHEALRWIDEQVR
ncbi:MAG: alpha/beta hydrolase [Gammaproteobacteria bacterium]|nr:alpha/beta hydrolase [Gammaproteobacteria bacterium]